MYKCLHCGEIFDEPDKKRFELCRIDGVPQYANDDVCPCCGASCDEFEDVYQCDECGEYVRYDELSDAEDVICKECFYGKKVQAVS